MNRSAPFNERLVASLEEQARSVDAIFAAAGRDLGEGLSLFEAMKGRLTALSGQLSGEEIVRAGAALGRLAENLRPLRQILAEETGTLLDIATYSAAAGRTLDKLVEHIRLITILARSARIESISIQGVGRDFGDFANEIVELTTQARRTIEACAEDHARMSALLTAALASQREFETQYGTALSALADKLSITLAEVEDRQRRGLSLTSEAAARSGKIAMAAGMAIVALQSGDSVRQRLEHAIAALRLAATLDGRTIDGLPEQAAPHARELLLELEAEQLDAAAAALGEDAAGIEQNLLSLRHDTEDLVDLVRSLYGTGGAETGSFMAELGNDLAHASSLLGKCNAARAGIDKVAQALTRLLDTCQETVDTLATTVSNIVLIGINAGLRAGRVGSTGRSLVVIAQELKLAADLVASDARTLPAEFERMQLSSTGLKRWDRLDAAHFSKLDREMGMALAVMQEVAMGLAAELDRLTREGTTFGKVLDQARLGFSSVGPTGEAVATAAHAIAAQVSPASSAPSDLVRQARSWVTAAVWRHYTMAVERTIHCQVVGTADGAASQLLEAPSASDDLEALLF